MLCIWRQGRQQVSNLREAFYCQILKLITGAWGQDQPLGLYSFFIKLSFYDIFFISFIHSFEKLPKTNIKKIIPIYIIYIYTYKISKLASSDTFLSCFFSLLSLTWKGLHRAQFMFYELAIHFLALTVPLDSGISIYYGII